VQIKYKKIPPEIGMLPRLTILGLANNKIQELPVEMMTLTTLVKLDLANNLILTIPAQISSLVSLQRLNLIGNKISNLPLTMKHLKQLQELFLLKNPLCEQLSALTMGDMNEFIAFIKNPDDVDVAHKKKISNVGDYKKQESCYF